MPSKPDSNLPEPTSSDAAAEAAQAGAQREKSAAGGKAYAEDQIKILEGLEAVRKRRHVHRRTDIRAAPPGV